VAAEFVEREDKYDVAEDFAFPDLTDVHAPGAVETTAQRLDATYFDTARGHLRRAGITLRRRQGGDDAGWHVKLPLGGDRTEIHVDSRATTVPREVSALLLGVRGGERLVATVKISTDRANYTVLDASGLVLAVVSDDRVRSRVLSADAVVQEWREVEVEVGPAGDDAIRASLGQRLRDADARPAVVSSKFARATGAFPVPARRKRLAGLVDDYMQTQLDALAQGDLGLRRDLDVIHPTRVAVRRLRSTLRVFAEVFDPAESEHLQVELAWFAGLLGRVRDCDVLGRRLAADVAALPAGLMLGPVAVRIELELAEERAAGLRAVASAMNGRRYAALVRLLERWRVDPPYTAAASRRRKTASVFVAAAQKQLRRRLRAAAKPGADDDLVHRARKAGKRLRYAAELASTAMGGGAKSIISRAEGLQTRLGEFQDSVMAADVLTRLGARAASTAGEDGFTYGLLLGRELQRADAMRASIKGAMD